MASKADKATAIADHKAAHETLAKVSKRDGHESDAYLKANQRVIDAEKSVPWYRR